MDNKLASVSRFFLITILFSWIFWGILIQQSNKENFTPYGILFYVGGSGPLFAAVTLTFFEKGREGVISLFRSCLSFKSITVMGVLLILLVSLLPNLLAVLIQKTPDSPLIAMRLSIESTVPWFTFLFIVSIVEEIGWRGYSLSRLLNSVSPVLSSLTVGSVWALWHIPLFLLPGTWQHGLGFMTPVFWSYMLQLLPRSLLMTWVFTKTGNNPASAVLFHTIVNLSGELLDVTARADLMRFGIEVFFVLVLYLL